MDMMQWNLRKICKDQPEKKRVYNSAFFSIVVLFMHNQSSFPPLQSRIAALLNAK